MNNEVVLDSAEIILAANAGILRQTENIHRKRQPYHGATESDSWQKHVEGCLGEKAFAKWAGLYWPGKGKFRDADVGIFQVRRGQEHHYRLILHKEDHDDQKYWLVTGKNGTYIIQGWNWGREGKKEEYWKDPGTGRPAYFVPRSILHPAELS